MISGKIFISLIIGRTEIIPIKTGIWINANKFKCFLNVSIFFLSIFVGFLLLIPALLMPALAELAKKVIPKKYNPEIIKRDNHAYKKTINYFNNDENFMLDLNSSNIESLKKSKLMLFFTTDKRYQR